MFLLYNKGVQGPREEKNVLVRDLLLGPLPPPFPTLVIYVDDSFALYMYLCNFSGYMRNFIKKTYKSVHFYILNDLMIRHVAKYYLKYPLLQLRDYSCKIRHVVT